jgi:hypothetical protein
MLCPLRTRDEYTEEVLPSDTKELFADVMKVKTRIFLPCYGSECMFYNMHTLKCDVIKNDIIAVINES